ncbi:MAG: thioredoxin family protein [Simkania sp.]|nr:thioredoxin family protein [Simkania sp.]MCP5489831.1 thioredoxin family protein [Chlamydiales bacterium]
MKKLLFSLGFLLLLPLHCAELDQFQWGMKKYLTVLEKGMQLCEQQGYAYFKVEHCLFKSEDGKELSFKDTIRDPSGKPYEETTPWHTFTLYLYKDKPDDLSAVDVKKHNLLKKLASKPTDSSAQGVKEIQSEKELLREIETSLNPIYIKCFSPTCPPCGHLAPFFQNWATVHADKGKFLAIDLNKMPTFRERYQVDIMPTLLIFNEKGDLIDRYSGLSDIGLFIEAQLSS